MRRLHPAARLVARLLATGAWVAPAALVAQTTVIGTVVDSTRGAAPLVGAAVQLVSRTDAGDVRTAATDSLGAFLFDAVPPGDYLLGFLHPRLDALALQPPLRVLRAAADAPVLRADLAVPGGRTVVAAICGGVTDSTGLLMGRVLDAGGGVPGDGAGVTVRWVELVIGRNEIRRDWRTLTPPVTDDGRYVACGVPSDTPVLVRATAGSLASGEIELRARPFDVLQRDLLVAPVVAVRDTTLPVGVEPPRRGTARLAGRVRRADGRPMERAVVTVAGSGLTDTTDAQGRFALAALPAGTFMLEARAIGYTPQGVAVDLVADGAATADVTLDERVATLAAVTVYGEAGRRGSLAEFTDRSRGGFGHFISPADIARRAPFTTTDLLRQVPGMRVIPSGAWGNVIGMRNQGGGGPCLPAVFVDGMQFTDGATGLDRLVSAQEVAAMEVYVGMQTPAQFQRNACGSVLVWTKARLR